MIWLGLSVLCSVLIANFLMVVGRKSEISMLPIFLGNYFVASLFSAFTLPDLAAPLSAFDLGFGIFTGALFLANFWVYQKCIVANGLSLSVGSMRIAMIIPVLIALVAFGEELSWVNILGIGLGLLAFTGKSDPKALHNLLWILLLFVVSGFTDAATKIYKELGSGNEAYFVYFIFSSAFIYTLLSLLVARVHFGLSALLYGFALGIPNRFSTVFFLRGLDSVPAAIAYPLVAVLIVLLSIICDILIWKKRAGRSDIILWVLLIFSLMLLNM
ncbi:MAG TPA: hypothetical protein PLX77_02520 [Candidatus Cloacimonadota bacterium]|nr:hypothetical protein [Candidatus Cloacimonadota bacterium]